jgi:hypothetical protein
MRKKFVWLLLVIALVALLAVPAFAASGRYGLRVSQALESTGIFVDDEGNNMDYGVWVYGVKIYADAASSFMGIYNADTESECTVANLKDETGEATQYDTAEKVFQQPLYFSDGVYAIITTGVGWVIYGAQP